MVANLVAVVLVIAEPVTEEPRHTRPGPGTHLEQLDSGTLVDQEGQFVVPWFVGPESLEQQREFHFFGTMPIVRGSLQRHVGSH